ncbi:MAG: site-specific integrase [Bacteroidetes bacterium]|nr:site-specific integrase [Bacteroidota bacterium]HET6243913.1 site-specific integrase [Bacteroidia bacterium]
MNQQNFYYFLKDEKLAESSIQEHIKNIERFEKWAEQEGMTGTEQITYTEILGFVQHLKSKSVGISSINNRLNSIRKYYEHLKAEGTIEANPARRVHIKGNIKKVIHQPLSYTELEQLYQEYAKPKEHYREEKGKKAHKRNTVILSLMIWQAIHSGELNKIEISHVKLNEGVIYIPSTRRSNSREIKLESKQIILLHQYISENNFINEKLFDCHPANTMMYLVNELKGINQVVKNAGHIRASIILHWIKMYSKRQVQYMVGHKHISSTEHYEIQELTGLTDLLTKHHPFS